MYSYFPQYPEHLRTTFTSAVWCFGGLYSIVDYIQYMLHTATIQSAICICRGLTIVKCFSWCLWGTVGSCLTIIDPTSTVSESAHVHPFTGSSISPLCSLFALSWKRGLACCTGQR